MNSRYLHILFGTIVLLFFTSSVYSAEVEKQLQESVDVKEGMTFELIHGDGHVTITPWDRDEIRIDVKYHYEFTGIGVDDGDYDFQLDINERGNSVQVEGVENRPRRQLFANTKRIAYAYKISAPPYLILDLTGDDGNVTIREWENNITINGDDGDFLLSGIKAKMVNLTAGDGDMLLTGVNANLEVSIDDGDAELSQIRGDITINAEDGDLTIRNAEGTMFLNMDDGDISLSEVKTLTCRIDTEDGDVTIGQSTGSFTIDGDDARIRIDEVEAEQLNVEVGDADVWAYLLPADNIDVTIQTEDGDVELHLAPNFSANITLETDGGSIDQELESISDIREGDGWFTAVMNDGEGTVRVETEDGDIRIEEGL